MCGCILAILVLGMPRLVLAVIWLATNWFSQAYDTVTWPLLGWFFMPYTTAAYMAAMLNNDHQMSTGWLVIVILAVLADLGAYGSGRAGVRGMVIRTCPPREL